MKLMKSVRAQRGVALALSLLLLLVLTIIGVAAMNSTIMQERMAGNIQTQTRSFETSAEGVGRALEFYHQNFEEVAELAGHHYGLACGFVHSGLEDYDGGTLMAWAYPGENEFLERGIEGAADGLRLEQQMYCCRNWSRVTIEDESGNTSEIDVENPSKLFVLSRGSFVAVNGEGEEQQEFRLATREIEVRLDEAEPGNPTCAFCVPGEVGEVDGAESGNFRMHGACGPAITTESPDGAATFLNAIKDKNKSNYDGGITHGDMGEPWNSADKLAEFVFWAKLGLPPADTDAPELGGYWRQDQIASPRFNAVEFGTEDEPQITYFDGSVAMAGNVEGQGIMIVKGGLEWRGTPKYQGLIIVLGGDFKVSGGGEGGAQDPGGSIVTTNLLYEDDSVPVFAGPEVLRYPVAYDADGNVEMHVSDEFPDGRPAFLTFSGEKRAFVAYWQNHPDHGPGPFYDFENEVGVVTRYERIFDGDRPVLVPRNSDLFDPDRLEPIDDADYLPRDKFGRLLPNPFEPITWPPAKYEYSPNRWGWGDGTCVDEDGQPEPCDGFMFGASNFDWGGGGGQAFTYDCRKLQQMRHRLLCETKDVGHDPDLAVDDGFYDEGDHSDVCDHWDPGEEYNPNVDYPTSGIRNQHAWHLWAPQCECMGLTRDADMIISGWRENLGWRDDDFAACAGLPEPQG